MEKFDMLLGLDYTRSAEFLRINANNWKRETKFVRVSKRFRPQTLVRRQDKQLRPLN